MFFFTIIAYNRLTKKQKKVRNLLMKKLRRYLVGLMFACWAAVGVLQVSRMMMKPPIPHCEENPYRDVRTEN